MEINMERIAFKANRYEVTHALAEILHTPEFSPAGKRKINFRVTLNEGNSGVQNNGTGVLILPDRKLGDKFMKLLLRKKLSPITVHGRQIFFRSGPKPSIGMVQTLQKVPFQDPSIDEERDQKLWHLDRALRVDKLQFGVWSRQPSEGRLGIFCSEWARSYTSIGNALIWIEYDHKLIRLQLGDSALDELANSVVIKFTSIQNLWIGYEIGNPFVCFELLTPPVLECEWFNRTLTGVIGEDQRKFRQRIGSIDPSHERVAPYAYQVRVVLYRDQDLEEFARLCSIAGLRKPLLVAIDSESHDLFSQKKLIQVERWFKSLDFPIAFQLEALLHNGLLHTDQLLKDLWEPIHDLCADHPTLVSEILRHFLQDLQSQFAPENVLARFQRVCARKLKNIQLLPLTGGLFLCYHVTFTPTRMTLEGPYAIQSNRVIRRYARYHDHFIRVDFRDEDRLQYRWDQEVDGTTFLQERVGRKLKEGFVLAGRHFQFLAYSSSALRDHAVWFMNPFDHPKDGFIDAAKIRKTLGDFSGVLTCPSKYAARLAQAFTATDPSVTITRDQWEVIPDMGTPPYEFTDGVGTISRGLSDSVWEQLCQDRHDQGQHAVKPSAYQIRFLGYKGMVSVDDQLQGNKMCLRPSMDKFQAGEKLEADIEIARSFEKPGSMHLNRPLIMILEDRGVDKDVFLGLQDMAVADARTAHDGVEQLCHLLKKHALCMSFRLPNLLERLNKLDLDLGRHVDHTKSLNSPFMDRIIHYSVNTVLRDIKHRARIPVPNSWTLVGVADEGPAYEAQGHQKVVCLNDGEIFVCIKKDSDAPLEYLKGNCIISRSPTVHPGDVQRVWAIGEPPAGQLCLFRHLVNVAVLPSKGPRSLASCLGGGDLDGDLYDITQNSQLLPSIAAEPAAYPPVDKFEIDLNELRAEDGTIDEERIIPYVCDFVVEYINSDVLGLLSDNHLIRADQSADGVFDVGCMRLARLCSQAVDYPKNGMPVDIRGLPRRLIPYKPDWKRGEEDGPRRTDFYESTKALGDLFRLIDIDDQVATETHTDSLPRLRTDPISSALEPIVIPKLLKDVAPAEANVIKAMFQRYTDELRYICVTHTLSNYPGVRLSEEEIVVGTILAQCTQQRWRRERIYRMRLHASTIVQEIKKEIFFKTKDTTNEDIQRGLEMAWQAWQFSTKGLASARGDEGFGLSSFGLIALNVIFDTLELL